MHNNVTGNVMDPKHVITGLPVEVLCLFGMLSFCCNTKAMDATLQLELVLGGKATSSSTKRQQPRHALASFNPLTVHCCP